MSLVFFKLLFAVVGYLIAVLVVVKPWYHALPSWPYRLPLSRKELPPTSVTDAARQIGA
jgi:hypothetical protein